MRNQGIDSHTRSTRRWLRRPGCLLLDRTECHDCAVKRCGRFGVNEHFARRERCDPAPEIDMPRILALNVLFWLLEALREAQIMQLHTILSVIADVISAHCPGTFARQTFIRACFLGDWVEAKCMVEVMLAEPWVLRGYQEARLREFLHLLSASAHVAGKDSGAEGPTTRIN